MTKFIQWLCLTIAFFFLFNCYTEYCVSRDCPQVLQILGLIFILILTFWYCKYLINTLQKLLKL